MQGYIYFRVYTRDSVRIKLTVRPFSSHHVSPSLTDEIISRVGCPDLVGLPSLPL
jgi:hypothetical protein